MTEEVLEPILIRRDHQEKKKTQHQKEEKLGQLVPKPMTYFVAHRKRKGRIALIVIHNRHQLDNGHKCMR